MAIDIVNRIYGVEERHFNPIGGVGGGVRFAIFEYRYRNAGRR